MNDMRFAHVLSFCLEHPWAITRPMLQTIAGVIGRRVAGRDLSREDLATAIAAARTPARAPVTQPSTVAVIPIHGIIVPRADLFSDVSGGTSADALAQEVRAAVNDPTVSAIVLDVDSPGGNVAGITELAAEVRRGRASKPIHAVASYTMASAAYWIAAQATKVSASPSASVGSIGVLAIHKDLSKALADEGVKVTVIAAGKFKAEGSPFEPLSEEAHAFITQRVNESHGQFVRDVALGRGVKPGDVESGYGEGRVLSAPQALAAGLVDEIATLEDVIARLQPGRPALHSSASADASDARASQERSDVAWLNTIERSLLDLDIVRTS